MVVVMQMVHGRSGSGVVAAVVAAAVLLGGPAPAQAYTLLGGHWSADDGPVEYTISSTGSDDVQLDEVITAVKHAMRSWECQLCGDLQLRYVGDGPNSVTQDNTNAVFWLEDTGAWQAQTGASVQSTLGITFHYDSGVYSESDIAFNGAAHTWSADDTFSATDIESVAVHEIGHFVGLGHPCTDPQETDCLGPADAVMTPAYPGGDLRTPRADDVEGFCTVYTTPKTVCEGKQRLKETCERDCDCEEGLLCAPDGEARMCTRLCGAPQAKPCPLGTACVLSGGAGGDVGMCLRNRPDGKQLDGTVCTRNGTDDRCETGTCGRARAVNQLVCFRGCTQDADCNPGYACMQNACVVATVDYGVPCGGGGDAPRGGCPGCSTGGGDAATWALGGAMWVYVARRRRRKGG